MYFEIKKEKSMLLIFVRTIILYILVLVVMRFMGKREIGQLQPFELAISIMIADLATIPMTEPRHSNQQWNYTNFRFTCYAFNHFCYQFKKCSHERNSMWKTIYFNIPR